MSEPGKASLWVDWDKASQRKPNPERIPVQYNPTELVWDKGAQIAEITIPGLDAPLQQFVRGHAEKLSLELFFDSTDEGGMGDGAISVSKKTDRIYELIKIEPTRHAPPICTFVWNDRFPGSTLNGDSGKPSSTQSSSNTPSDTVPGGGTSAPATPAGGEQTGNQRRNAFRCIVESVKQKFTLFNPNGVPLRATVSVTLREYKTLDEQINHVNPSSPDRTHSHVLQTGDTLSAIAGTFYQDPGDWRVIADANGIEDPRRLQTGFLLMIPPTR